MFSEVKPLQSNIKVKRLYEEQKTTGGIYIPDEANEFGNKIYSASVLSVGPDVKNIVANDTVLCRFQAGLEIDYDIIILEEKEVVGKF
jgi:chaperonin GroES